MRRFTKLLPVQAHAATAVPPIAATGATVTPTFDSSNKRSKIHHDTDSTVQCETDWQAAAGKRGLPKLEVLEVCDNAINDIVNQKSQGKLLVDPLKSWAYKVSKVLTCCKECYANDKEAFVQANPNFTISRYQCKNKAHKGCIP